MNAAAAVARGVKRETLSKSAITLLHLIAWLHVPRSRFLLLGARYNVLRAFN